jgi:hypothetical protein
MAFTPTDVRLGGSFVQDLSGFQRDTLELGSFFAGKVKQKANEEEREAEKIASKQAAAAEVAYMSTSKNDSFETFARIASESNGDLDAYNNSAQAARDAILKDVPEIYKAGIEQTVDTIETKHRLNIMAADKNKKDARIRTDISTTVDTMTTEMFNFAAQGNDVGDLLNELKIVVDDSVNAGAYTYTEGVNVMKGARKEVQEQGIRFKMGKTYESDGAGAALADLDSVEQPSTWTPDEWDTFKRSIRADFSRRNSNVATDKRKREIMAAKEVNKFLNAKSTGFNVSQKETADINAMAQEFPELQRKLADVEDIAAFALLPMDEQRELINETNSGDLDDAPLFKSMVQTYSDIRRLAKDDVITLAINQGVPEIPIDLNNIDPVALEEIVARSDALEARYGVGAILSKPQLEALTEQLPSMTIQEKVRLANSLTGAPSVWGEISGKGAGVFAMTGAIGDQTLMGQVFTGQELLNNKLRVSPTPKEYLPIFREIVGDIPDVDGVLGSIYGREDGKNVLDTALAHYAATSPIGKFEEEAFRESVQAVTGGVGDINGYKVQLARYTDIEPLEDYIDDFSADDVAALGGVLGMTDEQAAKIVQGSRLKNMKMDNNEVTGYRVLSEYGPMTKPDGSPFIITWSVEEAEEAAEYKRLNRRLKGSFVNFDDTDPFSDNQPSEVQVNESVPAVEDVLKANASKNFVKRIMNPKNFPVIDNGDGSVSTHRMASGETDGRFIAYPTITQDKDGSLRQREDRDAFNHAMKTGEFIEFNTDQEAREFAEGGYKVAAGWEI